MTAKQLAEMVKAQDCARMLTGQEQPRQEAFVTQSGDVDWDRYDNSWAVYNARHAQMVDLIGCHGLSH
jgi:hypothetical protein